jgi:hypothetical protein
VDDLQSSEDVNGLIYTHTLPVILSMLIQLYVGKFPTCNCGVVKNLSLIFHKMNSHALIIVLQHQKHVAASNSAVKFS